MATETRSGPKSEQEEKEFRVLCSSCDRPTVHRVIRSAEYQSEYEEPRFSVSSWDEYQIVECRGCESMSFRHVHRDTEDVDIDDETGEAQLAETVKLYPDRLAGRTQLDHAHHLPRSVLQVYLETLNALRSSLPILAAIGIRALAEAMCKDRQAKGRDLEKKLDSLVEQGLVSSEGAEILHGLRLMGNKAAHEVTPHSLADLNTAFDVIEHALQGVYILPKLAARLPKRTKKVVAAPSPASPGAST